MLWPLLLARVYCTFLTLRVWSRTQTILYKHMLDVLVPPDLQSLLRDAWEVLQDAEWASDVGYDKAYVLLTSIFCLIIVMRCWGGAFRTNTSEIEGSPAVPVHTVAVDWKSHFSISEMARLNVSDDQHEGGCIYPTGTAAEELSGKDATAVATPLLQRYELNPWLRETESQSSDEELSFSSQRWIDEDHGAIVSTTLEDPFLSMDSLGPPGDGIHSDNSLH